MVEILDEGVEDAVEVRGQYFCAALRPELERQCLGQRRKPGDVRKQCGAVNPIGHGSRRRQRLATIARDVGFQVIERDPCGGRGLAGAMRKLVHPFSRFR